MCLLIEITAPAISYERADAVSKAVTERSGVELRAHKQRKHAEGSRFFVGSGCACELLGENATWDAAYYELAPLEAARFVETLRVLMAATRGKGFRLRAAWIGAARNATTPARTQQVVFLELLREMRLNRIANVEYIVT